MYRRIRTPTPSDRELAGMDRMRLANAAFGRRETTPQPFEMVPPQPVHLEGKRSFWNPKQASQMGDAELRDKLARLDKMDKIVSKSTSWATMAEMLAFIGRLAYKLIENGTGKGKLDEIDIGLGIAFGATLLVAAILRIGISDDRNECLGELLKRAEQK